MRTGAKSGEGTPAEALRRRGGLVGGVGRSSATAARQGCALPQGVILGRKITQHLVKLIRWIAVHLRLEVPWKQACAALAALYTAQSRSFRQSPRCYRQIHPGSWACNNIRLISSRFLSSYLLAHGRSLTRELVVAGEECRSLIPPVCVYACETLFVFVI